MNIWPEGSTPEDSKRGGSKLRKVETKGGWAYVQGLRLRLEIEAEGLGSGVRLESTALYIHKMRKVVLTTRAQILSYFRL